MLTDKEVKKIAKLAHIELSEKEETKFKDELSVILNFVNKLNEVDTENIESLYQTTGIVNSMRHDISKKNLVNDEELNAKLIGQAPYKENRFIKVKSILKK